MNVGCGKVETIRFARYRRSHDYELSYWSHHPWKFHEEMSVHRALAMLFLGEGRYGFKRDNLSIALLVISMYPIIAHNVADNRLYHQPLRFLWTYSVEPRLLVPMCRKKNKPIQCDVRIDFKDPSCSLCFCTAPMILPPIEELASVAIVGPGVEEVHFDLSNEDRKRDLMEILTKDHGRVPVTVTESCLDDNEMAQQEDWTLRQIFDHRVERPCCKVTKLAKELERMKMAEHGHFGASLLVGSYRSSVTTNPKLQEPFALPPAYLYFGIEQDFISFVNLLKTNHPGGPDDLRWPPIDSAPAIRQYLKTLHMVS
ncbi:unnamed protein product [Haemonchus placei]|uniref:Uncharacterized protein n=1 Tax=Haemonchus placei TaxID=6290 RepID=A0A3P7VPW0_HAEPC|nr:unnamed protein product [Haemonchus placei]